MSMASTKLSTVALQELITVLKSQLSNLKTAADKGYNKADMLSFLNKENAALRSEITVLKKELEMCELLNGKPPVCFSKPVVPVGMTNGSVPSNKDTGSAVSSSQPNETKTKPEAESSKPKPEASKKANKPKAEKPKVEEAPLDIRRLDLRIGLIVKAEKHPDADALYVETVDVGEEKPRTIVSGLANHVPLDRMQQRKAVFFLNLKPAKMRGIFSEGMIVCASLDGKVEILDVPENSVPGERVKVGDFPNDSPDAQLNPKKKIWETLKPECVTDAEGFATFRNSRWVVPGKGDIRAPTLRGVAQIS